MRAEIFDFKTIKGGLYYAVIEIHTTIPEIVKEFLDYNAENLINVEITDDKVYATFKIKFHDDIRKISEVLSKADRTERATLNDTEETYQLLKEELQKVNEEVIR